MLEGQHNLPIVTQYESSLRVQCQSIGQHSTNWSTIRLTTTHKTRRPIGITLYSLQVCGAGQHSIILQIAEALQQFGTRIPALVLQIQLQQHVELLGHIANAGAGGLLRQHVAMGRGSHWTGDAAAAAIAANGIDHTPASTDANGPFR